MEQLETKIRNDCAFGVWHIYNDEELSPRDSWVFKPFTWLFIRIRKRIRLINKRRRIRKMCHGCRMYGDCLIKDISNFVI